MAIATLLRVKGNVIHIQGKGIRINREYGVAVDLTATALRRTLIGEFRHTEYSLAGTDRRYVEVYITKDGDELVIHGVGRVRRNIESEPLFNFVEQTEAEASATLY